MTRNDSDAAIRAMALTALWSAHDRLGHGADRSLNGVLPSGQYYLVRCLSTGVDADDGVLPVPVDALTELTGREDDLPLGWEVPGTFMSSPSSGLLDFGRDDRALLPASLADASGISLCSESDALLS